MAHARLRASLIVIVLFLCTPLFSFSARADAPFNDPFRRTWERVDKPVADLEATRTWLWGPEAFSPGLLEGYVEAANGQRIVQYYDKSRMEITADPAISQDSVWYVTNGLLARELISGQQQTGNNQFEPVGAAQINVAGDGDDPTGPTYATFASLLNAPPVGDGVVITQRVTRLGALPDDPTLARHLVVAAKRVQVDGIDHQIASPFWAFMQSSGTVWVADGYAIAPLFESPFYATGYPITEAYWASVRLAGSYTDVLIQCFERRCLTYTPGNAPGWQVESGNIGRHYYAWRYASTQPVPAPVGLHDEVIVLDPGHDRTSGGALGVEYQDVTRTAHYTKEALEAAGYRVYLTRPDVETVLYGDPDLMPANASSMEHGYNQGYAHTTATLRYEPDLVISLHYNGSESSSVAGMTIYYCDQGGAQNRALAELVRDELREALRSRGYEPPYAYATEDGAIGKNYGHLASLGNVYSEPFAFVENRLSGVPAVLTEPLFESNPTERALIQDDATQQAFAAAYVRAVDRYYGR